MPFSGATVAGSAAVIALEARQAAGRSPLAGPALRAYVEDKFTGGVAQMMPWYGLDGWSWLWMAGTMVLFWGGVIVLGAWAIRALSGPRHSSDTAMDILRRRLAAGEISPEDFEKTKKALGA